MRGFNLCQSRIALKRTKVNALAFDRDRAWWLRRSCPPSAKSGCGRRCTATVHASSTHSVPSYRRPGIRSPLANARRKVLRCIFPRFRRAARILRPTSHVETAPYYVPWCISLNALIILQICEAVLWRRIIGNQESNCCIAKCGAFIAAQRVQLLPGKDKPVGRKRVLHVAVATPSLKRRQQVLVQRG